MLQEQQLPRFPSPDPIREPANNTSSVTYEMEYSTGPFTQAVPFKPLSCPPSLLESNPNHYHFKPVERHPQMTANQAMDKSFGIGESAWNSRENRSSLSKPMSLLSATKESSMWDHRPYTATQSAASAMISPLDSPRSTSQVLEETQQFQPLDRETVHELISSSLIDDDYDEDTGGPMMVDANAAKYFWDAHQNQNNDVNNNEPSNGFSGGFDNSSCDPLLLLDDCGWH